VVAGAFLADTLEATEFVNIRVVLAVTTIHEFDLAVIESIAYAPSTAALVRGHDRPQRLRRRICGGIQCLVA
jgi:hypothetical protein